MTQKPIDSTKDTSFSSLQLKTSGLTALLANDKNEKFSKEIELNRRYFIVGERRISSYWWASVFLIGGFGFLVTGISSYIKYNLFTNVYRLLESLVNKGSDFFKTLNFFSTLGDQNVSEVGQNSSILLPPSFVMEGTGGESLVFFPQGLLLCFYGSLALLLSLYWWLLIYWNVGGGFNEFNKKEGFMRIFRWGYPGKNRRIDIVYPLKDIEAIRVELNQSPGSSLLTAEQTIFVRLLSTPSLGEVALLPKDPTPSPLVSPVGATKKEEETPLSAFRRSQDLASYSLEQSKQTGKTQNTKDQEVQKSALRSKGANSASLLKVAQQGGSAEKIKREIPLGGIGQPLTLKEIEKQASELANYLQVALEGL